MLSKKKLIPVIVAVVVILGILMNCFTSVPAGHVRVATLFGKVQAKVYQNGFHFVNPFYNFTTFDVRNKTLLFSSVPVPTQDQLTSKIDVRIQYRLISSQAPKILENTGNAEQLVDVKLKSQVYSVLRDAAKTVPRAEDFFDSATQNRLQSQMLMILQDRLAQYGLDIQQVLLSNTQLPSYIVQAIKSKKVRQQQVQQEKAELQRVQIQSQQKVAQAEAEAAAASQKAKGIRILADAEAYKIKTIQKSIANSKGYIQLQALDTLAKMAKDPAAKLYFLNSDSPQPFPLLNLGGKSKG
ncbi:SPFH domain-containing protein [Dongshaea marina]|uniref:SPFH domain-containing protein n=1 Tax=Dongshaea marina TaxID=2047966 RepID=UPI000D3E597C|nr:SPFH domain-containing protein [Dongshaea marina]